MSKPQRTSQTVQTITTINAGNYESSPPPENASTERATQEDSTLVEDSVNANEQHAIADDTEVVEDSLENGATAAVHAQAQQPLQQTQSEDDDLYSLTPGRARPKTDQKSVATTQATRQPRKVSNNALDALLDRGAKVHKPVQKLVQTKQPAPVVGDDEDEWQRSQGDRSAPVGKPAPSSVKKGKKTPRKDREPSADEEDELQSFDDDLTAPVGSYPRSAKKPSRVSAASKTVAAQTKSKTTAMTDKPHHGAATGSLAALKQHRGEKSATPDAIPKENSARPALQPRDANAQIRPSTSKTATKAIKENSATPADGKLSAVKGTVLTQLHSGAASNTASKPAKAKARSKRSMGSDASNEEQNSKHAEKASNTKGFLKQPVAGMKATVQDEASVYDVPEPEDDDDADDEYRPTKKVKKGQGARPKRAAKKTPAPKSSGPSKKGAQISKTKAAKDSLEPGDQNVAAHAGPSRSTRAKMKAESGTVDSTVKSKKRPEAKVEAPEMSDEDVQPSENPLNAHFDDNADAISPKFPGHDPKGTLSAGNFRPSADREASRVIKKEKLSATTGIVSDNNGQTRDRGASQQDAIVLSDAESSSSEDELPSDPSPPESRTQAALGKPPGDPRRPQTPAIIHSSPPTGAGKSTKPTTAGLVDPESTRKLTIISFDKSGPRNQGTASAKSGRQSLPPAGAAASSMAKLHEMRQAQQSSGSNTNKTFTRDVSAAPSNVASDAQEALAGLKRQTLPPSRPVPKQKAVGQGLSLGAQDSSNYADDGDFAHIDQFEDTLMGDDGEESLHELNPVRSPRTLSQQQMPPPAMSKTEQKRPVNRAPVVPSMARAEVDETEKLSPKAVKSNSVLGKRQQAHEPLNASIQSKRIRRSQPTGSRAIEGTRLLDEEPGPTLIRRKPHQPPVTSQGLQRGSLSQRQTRRQKSSQSTVDIHGSPVPDGMIVGARDTVLETFSQQAPLSSDKIASDGRIDTKHRYTNDSYIARSRARQKYVPRLSSNTKAVPSEPSQESQAITHVARVLADSPFVAGGAAHPPTDPFITSEKERNQAAKCSSSALSEYLKKQAARAPPSAPPVLEDEDEDPDKTLVEPEPEPASRTRKSKPKQAVSFDSVSSSDQSTDIDEPSIRDMGIWRCALRPHQMNLFDALVNISHRLVSHLVSREDATENIVEDYRRRGAELVSSLRAGQAEDLRVHGEGLQKRKGRLERELSECARLLEECDGGSDRMRKGGRKVRTGDGHVEGLMGVMDTFC